MQQSPSPSRFSQWLDKADGRILSSFAKIRQAPKRAYSKLKKLPLAARVGVGAGSGILSVLAWFLIASLVTTSAVKSLTPKVAEAAGVYTNASTDADGNTQLAANSVTGSYTYNLDDTSTDGTGDSSEANQNQMGIDPNWRNGVTRGSGALKFDGVDDYVNAGSGPSLNLTTAVTIDAWAKMTTSVSGIVYTMGGGGTYSGYQLYWAASSGYLRFELRDTSRSEGSYCDVASPSLNAWHHLAAVWSSSSGTTMRVFVDGVLQSSIAGTCSFNGPIGAPSVNANIGRSQPYGAYFAGAIDEVRVSSVARYTAAFTPQRRFTEDGNTVGLWHFDEGSGTTAYDSSGNANNGTLTNGPAWVDGAQAIMDGFRGCSPDDTNDAGCSKGGRTGAGNLTLGQYATASGALTFAAGSSQYVNVGNSASVQLSSGTVEAWFNTSGSGSGYHGIITKSYAYSIFLKDDILMLYDWGGGGDRTTAIYPVGPTWHHVAVTFQSGVTNGTKIWLDGNLVLTTTITVSNQSNALYIGGQAGSPTYFTGSIDEVRLSNNQRYSTTFTPSTRFSTDANTVGLWHFDDASGISASDSSGNGLTGTLTNGPTWSSGIASSTINNSAATDRKQYEVQMAPDKALTFNGSNQYGDAGNAGNLRLSSGTAEAWFKTGGAGTSYRSLLTKTLAYSIFLKNNILMFYDWGGGGDRSSGVSVTDNAWHHVAVTFSSGVTNGTKIWLDGAVILTTTMSVNSQSGNLYIANQQGASQYFNGSIDEIRISSTIRYSSTFTPSRRFASDSSTAGLWHLDEASGTTAYDASGNGSDATLTNSPTWTTGITRTDPTQGDPLYYQYRDVGGSWSVAKPAPSTSTQLGSSGIYVKFNPSGVYSAYDHFLINSWAVEAFSTSSPQRGNRRSFPNRAHLVATASGLDIIDASTNKLWMRLPTGTTMLGTSGLQSVAARNGRIYLASSGSGNLTTVRFDTDGFGQYSTSGNAVGARTIANRGSASSYGTASGLALTANAPTDVSVRVLGTTPPKQFVAVADGSSGRVVLLGNETAQGAAVTTTSEGTAYTYDRAVSASTYTKVLLASDGTLYASNSSAGGVDAWTSVQSDSANKTAATRTYTTSSTPALRSGTVTALAVTTGTSTAQAGSNTLAIGHALGTDVVNEHSTQASGGIRYYVREGSAGTSGYNQKNFGGALQLDGVNDYTPLPSGVIGLTTTTIELWFKTSTSSQVILGQGNNAVPSSSGNFVPVLYIDSSGYIRGQLWTGSPTTINSSTMVTDNTWHHIALVATGSTQQLFLDGVLRGTLSGTINNIDMTYAFIGASKTITWPGLSGSITYYTGLIDEVRISNTARYSSSFTPNRQPFTSDANTAALYHFDERDGQTIYDSSSNANNATLGASSSVASDDPTRVIPAIGGSVDKVSAVGLSRAGGTGRAISFDGSNDFVNIPNSTSTNITGSALTISAWINPSAINISGSSFAGILEKSSGQGATTGYQFLYRNGFVLLCVLTSSGGYCPASATTINTANTWYHVTAVYNGANIYLYINGTQSGSTTAATGTINSSAAYAASIGRRYPSNGFAASFNGMLSNVRLYNVAFSATDVANLYNAELSGRTFSSYAGNLAGYWKLDERSGQTVADSSGNSNGGTLGADSSVASDDPTPVTAGRTYTQSPNLWVATNDTGSQDGAVTLISQPNDTQGKVYLTSNSSLPSQDVTTLSMDSGGLAFIGTESGGWSTGTGGAPELTNGVRQGAMHIRGATRITGATRVSR